MLTTHRSDTGGRSANFAGARILATVGMGATTYIGNGPNLMVKAIVERSGIRMPNFQRYAIFA